jgi:MFS family permease
MVSWRHRDGWNSYEVRFCIIMPSIPDTMSAFLVPFCGIIVDYYGGRASFLLLCSLIIMAVHITLALSNFSPIIPLLCLGLSYSMYGVAIWPSIATVTEHQEEVIGRISGKASPKLVGTAFGISTSALNTALTIFPVITAGIRVDGGSFIPVEIFFASLAFLGAVFSVILWVIDVRDGSVLQRSS